MATTFDTRPGAYRCAQGKMALPTHALISEYKVHEVMLNSVLGACSNKELVDGPQEFTIEGLFEAVVAATAQASDRQSAYLGHGILPHTVVLDRALDPIFDCLGFSTATATDKADVAMVLEVATLRFYLFLSEFVDMVGFTEYQTETMAFSHWQGRDAVLVFNDY